MTRPEDLERRFTLLTAAARYDELRIRDALAPAGTDSMDTGSDLAADGADGGGGPAGEFGDPQAVPLSRAEALEMLALGELIARKAGYGRQLGVRTARATGASWAQIGAALGTTKQSAWETHTRWLADQDTRAGGEDGESATERA